MKNDKIGYVHSIETMGLLDGPGIRVVVFLQGCMLRCLYCHNPDTWKQGEGEVYTPQELVDKIMRYVPYFDDGGGVTFSGGEPLVQGEFLLECLKICKEKGIHTAIDTAGVGDDHKDEILDYTDLVIFDIKALDTDLYRNLVGHEIDESLAFLDLCQKKQKKMWIRQVIVPGINDNEAYVIELAKFLKPLKGIEKIEFLPYELIGVHKYKELGIPYRLENVSAMDHERCDELYEIFKKNLN